ncbi:hypothetical protein L1987_25150 [Smallanthus sonchifolius]|uniref:Uncharacterized protein n=1 Tax=Smallanthus sonchifolius TaxID=185202 RepID=A0ACB9IP66_9ASTR|nr:hypothetical protein L1987_25150 [Smallanthus sonchifolius]
MLLRLFSSGHRGDAWMGGGSVDVCEIGFRSITEDFCSSQIQLDMDMDRSYSGRCKAECIVPELITPVKIVKSKDFKSVKRGNHGVEILSSR